MEDKSQIQQGKILAWINNMLSYNHKDVNLPWTSAFNRAIYHWRLSWLQHETNPRLLSKLYFYRDLQTFYCTHYLVQWPLSYLLVIYNLFLHHHMQYTPSFCFLVCGPFQDIFNVGFFQDCFGFLFLYCFPSPTSQDVLCFLCKPINWLHGALL